MLADKLLGIERFAPIDALHVVVQSGVDPRIVPFGGHRGVDRSRGIIHGTGLAAKRILRCPLTVITQVPLRIFHGSLEEASQCVFGKIHGRGNFGNRLPFEVAPAQRLALIFDKLSDGVCQADRLFATHDVLAGRSLADGVILAVGQSFLARDGPLLGVELIPHGVTNVPFVNLSQPGGKLGRILADEFADLLMDRQAGLLHNVGRIDPASHAIVEQAVGEVAQVIAIVLEQFPKRLPVARAGAGQQLATDGVCVGVGIHRAWASAGRGELRPVRMSASR